MTHEALLNHSELYSLLYSGNTSDAIQLFLEQSKKLHNASIRQIRFYLSAINQGIYNYILFHERISLHKCCYTNEELIHNCTYQNYLSLGKHILHAYGDCTEYLIEKHKNTHVKNAISYIHEHLSEPLTLTSVCEAISLNRCYLCDLFSKEVGMTFCEYVVKQRILLAKRLLLTTNLPMAMIAARCGFNNLSYFSTSFKKVEGVTPSVFLKQHCNSRGLTLQASQS